MKKSNDTEWLKPYQFNKLTAPKMGKLAGKQSGKTRAKQALIKKHWAFFEAIVTLTNLQNKLKETEERAEKAKSEYLKCRENYRDKYGEEPEEPYPNPEKTREIEKKNR